MTTNFNPEEGKLPSSLNVLTILTFIGSGLFNLAGAFWQFVRADKAVEDLDKALNSPDFDKLPDFAKKMITPEALEQARLAATNKLPILIVTIVGGVLCIIGAVQMRKLKMQGYYIWLMGEIVPAICTIVLLGKAAVSGFGALIGFAFMLLFIILYTLQRKYLTNK
ncbi:MAG: hypothetical protein J0I09_12950 [Sphingobacteriia bacterium]|nr:hypothetical protein [Sphingobacteriia bacterium]